MSKKKSTKQVYEPTTKLFRKLISPKLYLGKKWQLACENLKQNFFLNEQVKGETLIIVPKNYNNKNL